MFEGVLNTIYTEREISDGFTSEAPNSHSKRKIFEIPTAPFEWKVKAGRSESLLESFYHAYSGLISGFESQRNLRIHFVAAVAAIVLGVVLRIDMYAWIALSLAIGLVLTVEFANTALEHVVDLATENTYHPAAKAAKDTAAGAVLVASMTALVTGAFIFMPHLAKIAAAVLAAH